MILQHLILGSDFYCIFVRLYIEEIKNNILL